MTSPDNRDRCRDWATAEEAAQQIEERLRIDPDYRAAVEAAEGKNQAATQARRDASRPILKDPNEAGIDITSSWVTDDKILPYSISLQQAMSKRNEIQTTLDEFGEANFGAKRSSS